MTSAAPRSMTAAEWGMLVVLSVLWGGSFFFNGVIVRELPPLSAVAGRLAIAAVVLLAVLRALKTAAPRGASAWAALVVMGLLNNIVPFGLIVWGQTRIGAGLASVLNATTPVFTVLVLHLFTSDEKLTAAKLAGVALGLAGVAVLIGPDLSAMSGGVLWAQLAVLGAALSYAFAGLWGRRLARMGVSPLAAAAGQVTVATLLLAPAALLLDRPWTLALSAPTWAALAALGVFSTALAYVLFFRILSAAGATNAMLVTLLVPVSAVLLGVLFLGERLSPPQLAGMGLITLGLAAIDGRLLRSLGGVGEPARSAEPT